jgi:hypothetical protein
MGEGAHTPVSPVAAYACDGLPHVRVGYPHVRNVYLFLIAVLFTISCCKFKSHHTNLQIFLQRDKNAPLPPYP